MPVKPVKAIFFYTVCTTVCNVGNYVMYVKTILHVNFNTGLQKQEKELFIYTEAVKQLIIHVKPGTEYLGPLRSPLLAFQAV